MKTKLLTALLLASLAHGQSIVSQPGPQVVARGQTASFSVTASGSGPLAYQWRRNGVALAGATDTTLTLANVQFRDVGGYSVGVSAGATQVFSAEAELRIPGTLWAAGSDQYGQMADGQTKFLTSPMRVLRTARQFQAGFWISLYLTAEGDLYAAGYNEHGMFGIGRDDPQPAPVKVASRVTQFHAGRIHLLYVTADGKVWAMGYNNGRFGNATTGGSFSPVHIATGVAKLAVGTGQTLLVKLDGSLWTSGQGPSGELGLGESTSAALTFTQVATDVRDVAAGDGHSLFVKTDHSLWAMGKNASGQLGDGTTVNRFVPIQVATDVHSVAAGEDFSLFRKQDGSLWGMGLNTSGQLGDGTFNNRLLPQRVAAGVSAFAAGWRHTLLVDPAGDLWVCGANEAGQLGDGTTTKRSNLALIASDVVAVSGGYSHSLFQRRDGAVHAVGALGYGELLNSRTWNHGHPLRLAEGIQQAAAGSTHAHYLDVAGRLYSLGQNLYGQLASGALGGEALAPVLSATNVAAVSSRGNHTLIVKRDGYLWGFGANSQGQLGDNTTTHRPAPVLISAAVSAASAGDNHSLFLLSDGRLFGMGDNAAGQLGDGTTVDRRVPIEIATNVRFAVAGAGNSFFITHDGTLWGMGKNSNGQLGDGTLTSRIVPVRLRDGVQTISPGSGTTALLSADGSVWTMGYSPNGRLGLVGLPTNVTTPVQVATGAVTAVSGGGHLCLLSTQGALQVSGNNGNGQLAAGSFSDRLSLTSAAGEVSSVVCLFHVTLFIQAPGTPPAVTLPSASSFGVVGDPVTFTAAASGSGPFDYRWQKDGVDIPGARNSMFHLHFYQASDAGNYRVVVTNSAGSVTSNAAQLESLVAPSITTHPQPQVLTAPGGAATFSVLASGSPVPTYQWARDGVPIAGATNATLPLANVQPAAVGTYTVTASNAAGSVRSAGAALEIRQAGYSAAHAAPLGGYVAGQAVTVSSTLSYMGTPSALSWSVLLPAGWTFRAASSTGATVAPVAGQTEVIDWAWSEIPASPMTFSYTLNVPAGQTGVAELVGLAGVRGTVTQQFLAQPDPLSLNRLGTHLADTDRNFRIGLLELTRLIELYNTRNGSVRTGAYAVATTVTEDGFVTAPERVSGALVMLGVHHSADSDRDGRIALLELTRVIELYNYRSGTVRTGQYRVQEGTEDGFAPGG